jgi:hypothetical protein
MAVEQLIVSYENKNKKIDSFKHSCIGDKVYDRYETAKIKL